MWSSFQEPGIARRLHTSVRKRRSSDSDFDLPDSKAFAFHDAFVLMEWVTLEVVPRGFCKDGTRCTRGHSAMFRHVMDSLLGMKKEVVLGQRRMPALPAREEATYLTSKSNFPAGRVSDLLCP